MKKMLFKIGFSVGDWLICAGDYIDRGPQSCEMLQWIENPGEKVILIRGNHDDFLYYEAGAGLVRQKRGTRYSVYVILSVWTSGQKRQMK